MHSVSKHKNAIEEAQREFRATEEKNGVEWPRMFFTQRQSDQEFEVLSRAIPDATARNLQVYRTAGVWKFIGVSKAEEMLEKAPLEPTGQVVHTY